MGHSGVIGTGPGTFFGRCMVVPHDQFTQIGSQRCAIEEVVAGSRGAIVGLASAFERISSHLLPFVSPLHSVGEWHFQHASARSPMSRSNVRLQWSGRWFSSTNACTVLTFWFGRGCTLPFRSMIFPSVRSFLSPATWTPSKPTTYLQPSDTPPTTLRSIVVERSGEALLTKDKNTSAVVLIQRGIPGRRRLRRSSEVEDDQDGKNCHRYHRVVPSGFANP